ncbi:MAG: dihydroorotase, partial [Actinobacteria bacterium]|nr:dihydroorotase [Actinomycetota bacterium]
MSRLLIKGGRVIDPASGTDSSADVLIDDGKVIEVGQLTDKDAHVVDVSGAIVSPGFIDLHVHLREPGREDEETIATGSAGAALGGFTAVVAMPNTDPVCDNSAVAEMVFAEGQRVGLVDVLPAGAITKGSEGKHIAAIGEMAMSKARVQMFTDDGRGVQDSRLLRRAMEYIKGWGGVCAEHCDDAALSEAGQMHEGEFSDALGLKGIPSEAEDIALIRDLALARLTGVRFHALHVSTAGSVDAIRRAKAMGLTVTAEVTPHHLCLTDAELVGYDTHLKVNPPLRSQADVEALRAGLADGTIDAIATDHAPHAPEEKDSEFELAPPGLLGLETALAVAITELVQQQVISIAELVRLLTAGPAKVLGLQDHGGPIRAGAPANLVVFDPEARWQVDARAFASLSRNTPWD